MVLPLVRGPACVRVCWLGLSCIYLVCSWIGLFELVHPKLGPTLVTFVLYFCGTMPIYEHKRAVLCTIPALALTPAPTLAGILDDLGSQIGSENMKTRVCNVMQHGNKAFLVHLASPDQVPAFGPDVGPSTMGRLLPFYQQVLDSWFRIGTIARVANEWMVCCEPPNCTE